MIQLRGSRQKRSNSATSKHKSTLLGDRDINSMQTFRAEIKGKKNAAMQKGRGKQNRKCKIGEGFPLEAVQFKNTDNLTRRQIQDDFDQQKLLNKYINAASMVQNKEFWGTTFNFDLKNTAKSIQLENQWSKLSVKKQKQYHDKFKEAVFKIFRGLDIFDRGTITETNINKWIPEEALYFLGNIFQKIREERLNLSCETFFGLCLPILEESCEEDLKHFLESINGKDYKQTVSINSSQASDLKEKESYVQLRIGSGLQSFEKKSYKPLIPFQEIIGNIKQKQLKMKIQNHPKEVKNINQNRDSRSCSRQNTKIEDRIKVKSFNCQIQEQSSKKQSFLEADGVPYFNFKIPDPIKLNQKAQPNVFDLTFKLPDTVSPQSSRIVHQKTLLVQDPPIAPKTERKPDTDRIDRLSSKLQKYIEFNKAKIERNKTFIRENSLPKPSF